MVFVTDFADQAVVLPLAGMVALVLGVVGWWRGLLAWAVAVGVTLGGILMLKLAAVVLCQDFDWGDPPSPSGHVASACVVYGGLAVLLLRKLVPLPLLAVFPVAVAGAMGYSRIALMAHDTGEVLVGAVVGLLGVGLLSAMAGARPRVVGWPVLGAAACTTLMFHGMHLPAEAAIRSAFGR